MFVVFVDQASTAKIYTHEFNIACMHAAERLLFRENLSDGIPRKFIPFEIIIPAIRYTVLKVLYTHS